jgi:hypothetical protein
MNKETPREAVKNVLERMREGGLWQPKGLGLSYVKSGGQTVILISQENIPMSADARVRMRMLIESAGWTVDESICEIIDVEYLTLEQKHAKEMMTRRDIAKNWKCCCGTKLSKFPLDRAPWFYNGDEEMVTQNGEIETVEQWHVLIKCPNCGLETPTDPYDYGLIGDDGLLFNYYTSQISYRVLDKDELIERIDNKLSDNIIIVGTFCPFHGDRLPPHLRGQPCSYSSLEVVQ